MTQRSPAEAFGQTPTSAPSTPISPSSSIDSSPRSEAEAIAIVAPVAKKPRKLLPLVLFVATVLSVLYAGANGFSDSPTGFLSWQTVSNGWRFAVPLLAILLCHEFGHFFAAKLHGVPSSFPIFLPMPFSPFGTWGAVISMPGRIASRRALLDIGAAGPIAGMIVAVPVLLFGLHLSEVKPLSPHGIMEGQSLLYLLLKRIVIGPIPPGYDVYLHPMAFAGWAGLFVTMINLLPFAQLDGGHTAYALLGERQDRIAPWIHRLLVPLFLFNLASAVLSARAQGFPDGWRELAISNSVFWGAWFVILAILSRVGGGKHPPTDPGETLDPVRRGVAIACLVLFVLLFMPAPLTMS